MKLLISLLVVQHLCLFIASFWFIPYFIYLCNNSIQNFSLEWSENNGLSRSKKKDQGWIQNYPLDDSTVVIILELTGYFIYSCMQATLMDQYKAK